MADLPGGPDTILQDIANAAPVGVLTISRDGAIRFVNAAVGAMFGYDPAELIGQQVEILLPAAARAGHAGHREAFLRATSARRMGDGKPLFGLHADGRLVPVQISLGSTGTGDDARAVAFINDISHRKQLESRVNSIVAALPVGLVVTDSKGIIVLTNSVLCEMFGHSVAALMGKPIEILLPECHNGNHPALREGYMRAPEVRNMGAGRELMAQHGAGHEFPVEIALSPILHEGHGGFFALVTDISVRKNLERSNLDEFTYIAAHDLRSPLRGINDLLDWIREDLTPDAMTESVVRNFDRAKLRILRAERMIDDLLIYARASERGTHTETISPRLLIAEVLELAGVPDGLHVEVDAPEQSFVAYKTPLRTALLNLVNNAVLHRGKQEGRIKVSLHENSTSYIFTVDDNGIGVPEAAREKIFKMFYRASSKTEGHGIGLSVTRRIIASHGGRLVLEEKSPLGGACFAIHWPRHGAKDAA